MVDALVLVAPSIDPNKDWWRLPLTTPFLSWILPTSFDVADTEIYHLKDELKKLMPLWKSIKALVTVIQGQGDGLVPPGYAEFARNILVNSADVDIILKEKADHFIPCNGPELIRRAILKTKSRSLGNYTVYGIAFAF